MTLRGGGDVDVGAVETLLCFRDAPPAHVGPESLAALPFLMDLPLPVDAAGRPLGPPLPVDDRGIVTADLPRGACVSFVVDVESAAARIERLDLASRVDRAVVASPDVWLWRPRPWPPQAFGSLVVHAGEDAEGATAAVPFVVDGAGGYVVPASAFSLQCYGALGRFSERLVAHAGARLRVVRVAPGGIDDALLDEWLTAAMADVAVPLGRFPVPELLALVAPAPGDRELKGGFLGRGGGASALLLVGSGPFAAVDDGEILDDDGRWVLTHELAHALLPPISRGDGWLNEGLATWHQEVLPASAGRRARAIADGQLAVGFRTGAARAARDGLSLRRACREMDARASHQHCYWGGAALTALLAAELGDDAVFSLVRALHSAGAIDAPPRGAEDLLRDVMRRFGDDGARRAARRLLALWHRWQDEPFPDVSALVTARGEAPVTRARRLADAVVTQ